MSTPSCDGCNSRDHRIAELSARIAELERVHLERVYLQDQARAERDLRPLTGNSAAMRAVRLAIQQVARTDSTVLIQGETGTGKELVARAIHQLSARRERLLVAVNCAALSGALITSELFGHEAGAYTGATRRRIGRFELAHEGSMFLDEVGDLPADSQVMLLRVLQERSIERVGSGEAVPVDVRVIAATHRNLTTEERGQSFRADLYFRLNVFPIQVPPLRDRRDDIPDLVRHFVLHFARQMNKSVDDISAESLQALVAYDWPGNVRELENIVERAMIVADGNVLEIDPQWLKHGMSESKPPRSAAALAEMERAAIIDTLARHHGKIYGADGAAAALGLKPTTLYGKMRKHQIPKHAADNSLNLP